MELKDISGNTVEILPDSRAREAKDVKQMSVPNIGMVHWVPIFCANCGTAGGRVPEENCTFAFYLCNNCVEKWGAVAGTYAVPDDVFWANVRREQQEKYGRQLLPLELEEVLKHENNSLTKLVQERVTA